MALHDEVRWFDDHQDELQSRYPDLYIVVYELEVQGSYETLEEAYSDAVERGFKEFLLRHVDHAYASQNFILIS